MLAIVIVLGVLVSPGAGVGALAAFAIIVGMSWRSSNGNGRVTGRNYARVSGKSRTMTIRDLPPPPPSAGG